MHLLVCLQRTRSAGRLPYGDITVSYTHLCADSGHGDRTVYVTAGGGHYHFNRACSSMVSYVRKVDLEDVGRLGVCSYCASRKKAEGGG